MKKFALLVLTALLFAGCNNMLTNPDAFSVEEASVSMDISQLKARVATDGAVITSTLDFVGDEPKHSPFEKTQTINGSTINYTIKGLPVGSSVQFKLSVYKNGLLVFEGLTNKITVKSKNELTINLNKQTNWVVYDKNDYYAIDLNTTVYDNKQPKEENKVILKDDEGMPLNGSIETYCTDDKENLYVRFREGDLYNFYRYSLKNKTATLLYSGDSTLENLYYDYGADSLVITSMDGYSILKNASTTGFTENLVQISTPTALEADNDDYTYVKNFCFFNNEIYWTVVTWDEDETFTHFSCKKSSLFGENPTVKNTLVYGHNTTTDDDTGEETYKFVGKVGDLLKSSFYGSSLHAEISEIFATKEGVFLLIADTIEANPELSYAASRGGVIKMDHNLTSASLYGWTNSRYVIEAIKNDPSETTYLKTYMPQTINNGFYGPTEIVAIKPKKLIFKDVGKWCYIDSEGNVSGDNIKESTNLIVFDLESCTYNAIPALIEMSSGAPYFSFGYSEYNISDYWK